MANSKHPKPSHWRILVK